MELQQRKLDAASAASDAQKQADLLAKERDEKFKRWLQNKAVKDKAFEYLNKLDSARAASDDKLLEVGIALCAVDRMLGEDEEKKKPVDGNAPAKRTLKSAWMRWAMEFHTFNMLTLTRQDLSQLSEAVKEFLFSEYEIAVSSGGSQDELAKADRTKNILPSLKYFFPTVPKPGEKPKPLTNDQKNQNVIYMRELKKFWKKAQNEMENRITEYIARGLRNDSRNEGMEKEGKSKSAAASGPSNAANERATQQQMVRGLESQCLNELSLKRLRLWVEEDEDEKLTKQNEDAAEKIREAKKSHEQFVRKKDGLRIRMPDEVIVTPAVPMSYGREFTGVRPNGKSVSSTIELMAGSGLKYVHATNKGRKGVEGDLEKSRKQLLKMGFVAKENFTGEDSHLYNVEKNNNQVIVERLANEQKLKEDSAKAYEDWLELKDMRDQAVKCLHLIPKPEIMIEEDDFIDPYAPSFNQGRTSLNGRKSVASMNGGWLGHGTGVQTAGTSTMTGALLPGNQEQVQAKAKQAFQHLTLAMRSTNGSQRDSRDRENRGNAHTENRKTFDHILAIGKALKKIDRTLFNEWAKWCDAILPINIAGILWDYFPPMACDVHSQVFSQVRDSFLKLLRPGLNYRDIFMEFAEKYVFPRKMKETGDEDDPEVLEELRKKWMSETGLNKTQFKSLLRSMGIVLKETEYRTLIDAFDSNGDGTISLSEFLEFCGPKRDKRGGNSLILNQRCCWLTTCKKTGMPNGYSVSNPTKRFLRSNNSESKGNDDYEESKGDGDGIEEVKGGTGKTVIRKLANGEQRMCVELQERVRREDILRKLRLITSSSSDNGEEGKDNEANRKESDSKHKADRRGGGGGDSEYENDYEDDYEDDHDHQSHGSKSKHSLSNSKTNGVAVIGPCDFSIWTAKERKEGLKYLLSITRDAREEQLLKEMITNGVPPGAPKFWSQIDNRTLQAVSRQSRIITNGKGNSKSRRDNSRSNSRSRSRGRRSPSPGDPDYDERDDHDRDEPDRDDEPDEEELEDIQRACNEITIYWAPDKPNELVSFYSIEFAGPVTTTTIKGGEAKYNEIFRDPEDADTNHSFSFAYIVRDLQPGTSYRFRIRAFNGFGPGDYTYKTFTTMTSAPLMPRPLKIAPDCVTLRWTFTEDFFKRLDELKRIYNIADKDKSGSVSREELNAILDEQLSDKNYRPLQLFLQRIALSKGLDLSQGYGVLFDMIENDDDGGLSWEEFEAFFLSAGWTAGTGTTGGDKGGNMSATAMLLSGTNNVRKSATSVMSGTGNSIVSKTSITSTSSGGVKPGDITYVIERCESELQGKFKEVMRTTNGQATVSRLDPGKSYRFRIYSINIDGIRGPASPAVLVHTMLETPSAPTLPSSVATAALAAGAASTLSSNSSTPFRSGVNARSIQLSWKPRNLLTNTRDKAFVDRMLGDWTHSHGENGGADAGVSIEVAFGKYDKNQSGDIDVSELACVLEDLGVEVTEERLAQAFALLDSNGDGTISFEEFSRWWRADHVTYVVKRSEEIVPRTVITSSGEGEDAVRRSTSRGRPGSGNRLSAIPEDGSVHSGNGTQARSRSAPRGGAVLGASSSGASVAAAAQLAATTRQVACPIVLFRDDRTKFEAKGLTPNSLYHFKVRYTGSRSNSALSPPFVCMTAPLPCPTGPVLIDVTNNTVRLKWYPPEFGCFKFILHVRFKPTSNSGGSGKGLAPIIGTPVDPREGLGEGWVQVYSGPDTIFTATTLASDTAYEARVFAVNYQGTASEASPSVVFVTLSRNELSPVLSIKNATTVFTVESTSDICVGDTILITERLFLRPKDMEKEGTNGGGGVSGQGSKTRPSSAGATAAAKGSSKAIKPGTSAGKEKTGAGGLTTMSVTSIITDHGDGVSITPAHGQFIGERTIAALVCRDNYRLIRDNLVKRNITPLDTREFPSTRKLWLEVIWQKGSTEACKRYEVKPGEVIERVQGHLEQFEVFRSKWKQESSRQSLLQEWNALKDCYHVMDC